MDINTILRFYDYEVLLYNSEMRHLNWIYDEARALKKSIGFIMAKGETLPRNM